MFLAALLVGGCAEHFYQSPHLPRDARASLAVDPRNWDLAIEAVDGKSLGLISRQAFLVPGEHALTVRGSFKGWSTTVPLVANFQAGRKYVLHGELRDGVFAPWVEAISP